MNIYDVKVCKFISIDRADSSYILKRSDYETHYCVIDFESFTAIDLFSGEQFRILKKNVDGKILGSEKVELNQEYAIYVNNVDFAQLTWWFAYRLKFSYLRMQLLKTKSNRAHNKQKQKKR